MTDSRKRNLGDKEGARITPAERKAITAVIIRIAHIPYFLAWDRAPVDTVVMIAFVHLQQNHPFISIPVTELFR